MRRSSFLITALSAMFVCGLIHAQDATEEENLEYEKLKVLEPLVGKYHGTGKNEETGRVWEVRLTIGWSESKKMLVREGTGRNAETEADLAGQEWEPMQSRIYYAWNHTENRIESIFVRPGIGVVTISEVKHEGDNIFTYTLKSTTGDPNWKSDIKAVVSKEGITYHLTNRQNAKREALEDLELKMKRIEE